MDEPESPITEKEIAHFGRAASDTGFNDVTLYLADLYKRLHKWGVEAGKYQQYLAEQMGTDLKKEKE